MQVCVGYTSYEDFEPYSSSSVYPLRTSDINVVDDSHLPIQRIVLATEPQRVRHGSITCRS